jgi:aminocarboxymuconate-semialdehyde decarboxylase
MESPQPPPARPAMIDAHAHFFGRGLSNAELDDDPRWPVLVVDSETDGRLMLGDTVFRQVRSPLWNVADRITEMDAAGANFQVISPVPITMATWAERGPALGYSAATNDEIAAAVAASGGRLFGLGSLPLPHLDESLLELERVMGRLGLCGVQVGTQVLGRDWDSPDLLPIFEAAEVLGAAIFIHPTDGGGGVLRRAGQPYDFGMGMTTDTAIAATAIMLAGVLERFPRLRLGFAHGCGALPWAYPRLRLGAHLWHGIDPAHLDTLVRRIWVDSLVLDPGHLGSVARLFGTERVMVGTDFPFVPGQLEGARSFVRTAGAASGWDEDDEARVLGSNAATFLGLAARAVAQPRRMEVRA